MGGKTAAGEDKETAVERYVNPKVKQHQPKKMAQGSNPLKGFSERPIGKPMPCQVTKEMPKVLEQRRDSPATNTGKGKKWEKEGIMGQKEDMDNKVGALVDQDMDTSSVIPPKKVQGKGSARGREQSPLHMQSPAPMDDEEEYPAEEQEESTGGEELQMGEVTQQGKMGL